ncbi:MAG: phospho-sugar mutase, partial [Clostridia bacterium]|nr:phospho-sugar mutase [Clostridia bacterium]
FVPEALSCLGLTQVTLVEEHMAPNGDFPTVKVPNPEDPGAYRIALELAKAQQADLILATDPDSDRTGAYALNEQGEYEMLNGNQIGILLLTKRASGKMPENPFAVSTIVSTRLSEKICKAYGVEYVDVLTGFKFIGEQIMLREEQGDQNFIFGFEESYGYLAGSYARDKDAVASCMLLAETAAFYKKQGKNLFQALNEIYAQFGAQAETQVSLTLSGEAGLAKMAKLMADLRACNGKVLDNCPSVYKDYKISKEVCFDASGNMVEEKTILLPASDVLHYTYPDFWFCLRPSGTEPKVKVYFGAEGKDRMDAQANVLKIRDMVMAKLNTYLD